MLFTLMLSRRIRGVFRWEIQLALRLLIYLTRGARPVQVTWGFLLTPHRLTQTQTQTFSNRITKLWLTVSTYLPRVRVFLMVLFPTYFFPRTPTYVTPNLRVEGEVNDGVMDQIARTLREFGFTPKGRARSYQKPYSEYFDTIPYPRVFRYQI
jgi:hypothetical protein